MSVPAASWPVPEALRDAVTTEGPAPGGIRAPGLQANLERAGGPGAHGAPCRLEQVRAGPPWLSLLSRRPGLPKSSPVTPLAP